MSSKHRRKSMHGMIVVICRVLVQALRLHFAFNYKLSRFAFSQTTRPLAINRPPDLSRFSCVLGLTSNASSSLFSIPPSQILDTISYTSKSLNTLLSIHWTI